MKTTMTITRLIPSRGIIILDRIIGLVPRDWDILRQFIEGQKCEAELRPDNITVTAPALYEMHMKVSADASLTDEQIKEAMTNAPLVSFEVMPFRLADTVSYQAALKEEEDYNMMFGARQKKAKEI